MCKLVSYDKLQIFLSICSSLALRFFFCLFLLYLTTIIALTTSFGLNLSEFIQATVHLLSRFSSSILAPCILLLLSSRHLLFLRILIVVLLLFYFLASWLTIFSHLGLAIKPIFSLLF